MPTTSVGGTRCLALVGDDEVDERHRPAEGQSILAFAESRMAPVTARSSALRTRSVSWAPDGDHVICATAP